MLNKPLVPQQENNMSWFGIAQAGLGAAAGIAGLFGQKRREERAVKNQKELMDYQAGNQMMLNDQQLANMMQYWEHTGPGGQMEQLKKAGLNPALMYGTGSGGGGSTGGARRFCRRGTSAIASEYANGNQCGT